MMKTIAFVIGAALVATPALATEATGKATAAKAEIKNGKGEKIGTAKLTDDGKGVAIAIEVTGLTPGKHGFHIHAAGKCEGPDFKTAGGHFNPHAKKHGVDNPEGAHGGDLPNLTVGADGKGKIKLTAKDVTLGAGKHSLLGSEGSAIVIHAKEDDGKTDPAGNAGDRIACGVVTKE